MRLRALFPLAAALVCSLPLVAGAQTAGNGTATSQQWQSTVVTNAGGAIPTLPPTVPAISVPPNQSSPAGVPTATVPTSVPVDPNTGQPVVPTATPPSTSAVPTTTTIPTKRVVDVVGHGYGHGRGLGQWGAYGYAVDEGWSYRKILDHYYGNTAVGSVAPQSAVGVRLTWLDGKTLTVYQEKGRVLTSTDGVTFAPPPDPNAPDTTVAGTPSGAPIPVVANGAVVATASLGAQVVPVVPATSVAPAPVRTGPAAVRIRLTGAGTFVVSDGASCNGPWVDRPAVKAVAVTVSAGAPDPGSADGDPSQLLQVCDGTSRRVVYRGDLLAVDGQPGQKAVNQVSLESYLRSVVPSEIPKSWGSTTAGLEAVKAQAVAARSYASAEKRNGFSNTCDTTACQVYRGRGEVRGGSFTSFEDSRTDAGVLATAGEIRVDPKTGVPIRTEFSSSTGGWTAPGVFPAVEDTGDDTPNNPHHTWTVRISASRLEAGRGLGALLDIDEVRDGAGPDGGRVQQLKLKFEKGVATMAGGEFASKFGLKSTLFSPTVNVVPLSASDTEVLDPGTLPPDSALAASDTSVASASSASSEGTSGKKSSATTTTVKGAVKNVKKTSASATNTTSATKTTTATTVPKKSATPTTVARVGLAASKKVTLVTAVVPGKS